MLGLHKNCVEDRCSVFFVLAQMEVFLLYLVFLTQRAEAICCVSALCDLARRNVGVCVMSMRGYVKRQRCWVKYKLNHYSRV